MRNTFAFLDQIEQAAALRADFKAKEKAAREAKKKSKPQKLIPSTPAYTKPKSFWTAKFVYLMANFEHQLCKIGFSHNVEKRRRDIERKSQFLSSCKLSLHGKRLTSQNLKGNCINATPSNISKANGSS
jgi:hypothetical protein